MAEIVPCPPRVLFDLGLQFLYSIEFTLVADAVKKAHAEHVAIQFAVKIENITFYRWLVRVLERRANADIGDALSPRAIDKWRRGIDAIFRNEPLMRFEISRHKSDRA